MAALVRIYLVSPKKGAPRLVEATHPANALRHVAMDEFRVEVASQQDLVDLVSAGTKVERVKAEQLELPAQAGEKAEPPEELDGDEPTD